MEEKLICRNCGKEITEDNLSTVVGYCEDCVETCGNCGEQFAPDTEHFTEAPDYKSYCSSCADDLLFTCDDCSYVFWSSDAISVHGRRGGERVVCENCYNEDYATCGSCGESHHVDNMTFDDNSGEWYCGECYVEPEDRAIHDYGYKPRPEFYGGQSNKEYMGIELEIDKGGSSDYNADIILNGHDELYAKHDGSINDGFEIVSHPCTLDYHLSSGLWEDIAKKALKLGYRSHKTETCGLHIHVSKTAFNDDLAIAKAIIFLERNFNETLKFSRRTLTNLRRWADRYFDDNELVEGEDVKMIDKIRGTYDRRKLINLQNTQTVEFRMFRGTLKPSTIFASLQFVHAIVEISNKYSLQDILTKKFVEYDEMIDESKTYLNQFLKDRGIVATETGEVEETE